MALLNDQDSFWTISAALATMELGRIPKNG
jgi:hypothetical protein